jgi:hypothetical protein
VPIPVQPSYSLDVDNDPNEHDLASWMGPHEHTPVSGGDCYLLHLIRLIPPVWILGLSYSQYPTSQ